MKKLQLGKLLESVFLLGTSLVLAANRVVRLGRIVFVLGFVASALTVASSQTGSSHTAEVHDHLHKAADYLKANDPNSAVKEFNAVLALDPKNAEAYANLGVIA